MNHFGLLGHERRLDVSSQGLRVNALGIHIVSNWFVRELGFSLLDATIRFDSPKLLEVHETYKCETEKAISSRLGFSLKNSSSFGAADVLL